MDARQALAAEYARMTERFQQKDVQGVYRDHTTPDYTMKPLEGPIWNRETVETHAATEMAWVQSVPEMQMHIEALTVTGDQAVATVHITAKAIVHHPQDPARSDRTLTRDSTARHTWVNTPQGWKLQYAEILSESGTMDGQPFPGLLPPQ
jgi:hypothetical protein